MIPRRMGASESRLISITFQLSLVHSAALRKKIVGTGGWQSLLRKLQKKLTNDNMLVLTEAEFKKIYTYSYKYGKGGFEDRLEGILGSIKDAMKPVVK